MLNKVEDFKDRFNKALSIRNIRPVELYEKTGISESTISQYRSGYSKPKEKKLTILADALDVNAVWLMGLDVPMEKPDFDLVIAGESDDPDLIVEIEKAKDLYRMYTKVSPEVQQAVELMLKSAQPKP